jgi:phage protein U
VIGVLLGADSIKFEASADRLLTWHDARRAGAARWNTHDVHAGKPKREFKGPGLDTIDLTVRLDIERGVIPRDELRKMRLSRDTGEVLQFTIGGDLVGDFTINSLDETLRRFDRNGVLTTAEVVLHLEEYR